MSRINLPKPPSMPSKARLKPLPKTLLAMGFGGPILGIVRLAVSNFFETPEDYVAFMMVYGIILNVLNYASSACWAAGLVGLWLATGRPRPWWLVFGLVGLVIPIVATLLLYEGLICEYTLLALASLGIPIAAVAMAWRGKVFPKMLSPYLVFHVVMVVIVNYHMGCGVMTPGYGTTPLYEFVVEIQVILPFLSCAYFLFFAALWASCLWRPPRASPRRNKGAPADMELQFE